MTTAELNLARITGHDVWVVLPYDGGRGWAEVLDERATPEPGRPRATVRVRLPDAGLRVPVRLVRPADCIRMREEPRR